MLAAIYTNQARWIWTPPVAGPTVFHQGGDDAPAKRKRKKRYTTQDLYEDFEQTIRALAAGPVHETPVVATVGHTPILFNAETHYAEAFEVLFTHAKAHEDLSLKLSALKREILLMQQRHLDDDEDMMLWL